jgi:magnesium-transporting ATPase (P-type)
VPFKSQNRFSAVKVRSVDGEHVFVMGGLDALKPRFTESDWIGAKAEELIPGGLRLLAFAEGSELTTGPLKPLALVALRDELRPDAAAVLTELTGQGMRFVILSGDDPRTVRATVGHLNLPTGPVRTGAELEAADRAGMIGETTVFGRVAPTQKVEVVTTLQKQGRRVAMIGDGVNDVLAVKTADLGVAMGAGSSATKTVAGLVLENDRFDLLPAALAEGRTVIHNVRRAAKLFLLKNVYTLFLIVVLVGILGEAFPYLPQQVTLLNALTIGGPVLLVMLSKAPPGVAEQAAFLPEVGRFVFGVGLPIGVAGAAVWFTGSTVEAKRTLLLTVLIVSALAVAVRVAKVDRRMRAWAGGAIAAYLVVMYQPRIADFFVLVPLGFVDWVTVIVAAAVAVIVGSVTAYLSPFPSR